MFWKPLRRNFFFWGIGKWRDEILSDPRSFYVLKKGDGTDGSNVKKSDGSTSNNKGVASG